MEEIKLLQKIVNRIQWVNTYLLMLLFVFIVYILFDTAINECIHNSNIRIETQLNSLNTKLDSLDIN